MVKETNDKRQIVGLPIHVFLYTLDQIADMLNIPRDKLHDYMFYDRRSVGVPPPHLMLVKNLKPTGEIPEWRLEEQEFVRWCRNQNLTLVNRYILSLR